MRPEPREPMKPRSAATIAGGVYLSLFAVFLVLAITGGDGSGLDYAVPLMLSVPWCLLLRGIPGLVLGVVVNAGLVAWAFYALANRDTPR